MMNSLRVLRYDLHTAATKYGLWYLGCFLSAFLIITRTGLNGSTSGIVFYLLLINAQMVLTYQRQNGSDKLFGSLPITHAEFLRGHYLFVWCNVLLAAGCHVLTACGMNAWTPRVIEELQLYYPTLCYALSFLIADFFLSGSRDNSDGDTIVFLVLIVLFVMIIWAGVITGMEKIIYLLKDAGVQDATCTLLTLAFGSSLLYISYKVASSFPRNCNLPITKPRKGFFG